MKPVLREVIEKPKLISKNNAPFRILKQDSLKTQEYSPSLINLKKERKTSFSVRNSDVDNNAGHSFAALFHFDRSTSTRWRSLTAELRPIINSQFHELNYKNNKLKQKILNANLKRGAKEGDDWAQADLEEDRERVEKPKLSTQNAPTTGKRRRIKMEVPILLLRDKAIADSLSAVSYLFWKMLNVLN